jgi:hypothetical protein
LLLGVAACDKPLEEKVYSSFGPNNFFKTAGDAEALLNAAYSLEQKQGTDGFRNIFVMAEATTDLLIIREDWVPTTCLTLLLPTTNTKVR